MYARYRTLQGVTLGLETLIRALWYSCDAKGGEGGGGGCNLFVFPLFIRCLAKENSAVQLEVGSDFLLYTFKSPQSIIEFNINLCCAK